MEGAAVRNSEQIDSAERCRVDRHLRFDFVHYHRFVLEGAKGGQDREAARGAQISFRRYVKYEGRNKNLLLAPR